MYLESPDQKIKWNVYSFDEGMASRVPYESAARVLTQSKQLVGSIQLTNDLDVHVALLSLDQLDLPPQIQLHCSSRLLRLVVFQEMGPPLSDIK